LDQAVGRFGPREWHDHANFLNRTSETVRKAGLRLAYHNHRQEFRKIRGTSGFDIILRSTSPRDVAIELDCGWAYVAGEDPAALMRRHRGRIELLHLKDMTATSRGPKAASAQSVPLGEGALNIDAIIAEARRSNVLAMFVEQEPPFRLSPEASARASWNFLTRPRTRRTGD
jgi:sugar phosphate isomerase/epimerase